MDKLSRQHERVGYALHPIIAALLRQEFIRLAQLNQSSSIACDSSSTPSDGDKTNLQDGST